VNRARAATVTGLAGRLHAPSWLRPFADMNGSIACGLLDGVRQLHRDGVANDAARTAPRPETATPLHPPRWAFVTAHDRVEPAVARARMFRHQDGA
jgi:hypothetical protein